MAGERKTFLMPVVALSEEFRDAFCNGVLKLYGQGELRPAGSGSESEVEETVRKMRARKWEVYIRKPPAGTDRLDGIAMMLIAIGEQVKRLDGATESNLDDAYKGWTSTSQPS